MYFGQMSTAYSCVELRYCRFETFLHRLGTVHVRDKN